MIKKMEGRRLVGQWLLSACFSLNTAWDATQRQGTQGTCVAGVSPRLLWQVGKDGQKAAAGTSWSVYPSMIRVSWASCFSAGAGLVQQDSC